jgi:hypothetical protein
VRGEGEGGICIGVLDIRHFDDRRNLPKRFLKKEKEFEDFSSIHHRSR